MLRRIGGAGSPSLGTLAVERSPRRCPRVEELHPRVREVLDIPSRECRGIRSTDSRDLSSDCTDRQPRRVTRDRNARVVVGTPGVEGRMDRPRRYGSIAAWMRIDGSSLRRPSGSRCTPARSSASVIAVMATSAGSRRGKRKIAGGGAVPANIGRFGCGCVGARTVDGVPQHRVAVPSGLRRDPTGRPGFPSEFGSTAQAPGGTPD